MIITALFAHHVKGALQRHVPLDGCRKFIRQGIRIICIFAAIMAVHIGRVQRRHGCERIRPGIAFRKQLGNRFAVALVLAGDRTVAPANGTGIHVQHVHRQSLFCMGISILRASRCTAHIERRTFRCIGMSHLIKIVQLCKKLQIHGILPGADRRSLIGGINTRFDTIGSSTVRIILINPPCTSRAFRRAFIQLHDPIRGRHHIGILRQIGNLFIRFEHIFHRDGIICHRYISGGIGYTFGTRRKIRPLVDSFLNDGIIGFCYRGFGPCRNRCQIRPFVELVRHNIQPDMVILDPFDLIVSKFPLIVGRNRLCRCVHCADHGIRVHGNAGCEKAHC